MSAISLQIQSLFFWILSYILTSITREYLLSAPQYLIIIIYWSEYSFLIPPVC